MTVADQGDRIFVSLSLLVRCCSEKCRSGRWRPDTDNIFLSTDVQLVIRGEPRPPAIFVGLTLCLF